MPHANMQRGTARCAQTNKPPRQVPAAVRKFVAHTLALSQCKFQSLPQMLTAVVRNRLTPIKQVIQAVGHAGK